MNDDEFYRRREAADEASKAKTDWLIKSTRMADSPEAFAIAGGLRNHDLSESSKPAWVPLQPIQFFDAGPKGNVIPEAGVTTFGTEFPVASSTIIGYCADMVNPNFARSDSQFRVNARYTYLPQQASKDLPEFIANIPAAFERRRFYDGTGFTKTGYWLEGAYLVEVFVDGRLAVSGGFVMS